MCNIRKIHKKVGEALNGRTLDTKTTGPIIAARACLPDCLPNPAHLTLRIKIGFIACLLADVPVYARRHASLHRGTRYAGFSTYNCNTNKKCPIDAATDRRHLALTFMRSSITRFYQPGTNIPSEFHHLASLLPRKHRSNPSTG